MKRIWVLIGSLFFGSSAGLAAPSAAALKVDAEETSPEAAKAAARVASSEADKWAASIKSKKPPVPVEEEATEDNTAPDAKPAAKTDSKAETKPAVDTDKMPNAKLAEPTPVPAAPVAPRRTGLNEIRGKLLSKSYDPRAIRLVVTGGINVEFAYDQKTSFQSQGAVISLDALGYDDELAVRYAGKDLYAIEVERVSKARRPEFPDRPVTPLKPVSFITRLLSKKWTQFLLMQAGVLFLLLWVIAGNDHLFKSTVPIEQRLVSRNEPIRKKAQQELLGLDVSKKKEVAADLIPVLQHADPFVVKWAAISLALIGPSAQETIPFLLQAASAKEKDAAQAVRVALSEIGAPDAQQLPSLLRALQDPRNPVRCESAMSIGKMGSNAKDVAPVLINLIQQPGDTPACFEEALASLAISVPTLYPKMIELLSTPHVDLRRKVARVLSLSGARETANITRILDLLGREADPPTRKYLAQSLQLPYVPEMAVDDVMNAALKVKDAAVRLEAARQVRMSAPVGRKYLSLILTMMRDSDSQIRRLGMEALRRSGQRSPDILQKVARAQRDEDPGVRCRAAESLIEYGYSDRVSIALLMGDLRQDEDTARCAENALSMAGLFDPDVTYSMIHLVQTEKDPDVRSRAAQILMHMGPRARQAVPALTRARDEKVPGAEMALRSIRGIQSRKGR